MNGDKTLFELSTLCKMDHLCNMNQREDRNRLSLFSPGQNLQSL